MATGEEVGGAGTGDEFWDWIAVIAVSATDDVGVDGNSCSSGAMELRDDSLRIPVAALFVVGFSLAKVSSATGVVSVVECVCGETSVCVCAMSVGGAVANSGLVSLDSSAM